MTAPPPTEQAEASLPEVLVEAEPVALRLLPWRGYGKSRGVIDLLRREMGATE